MRKCLTLITLSLLLLAALAPAAAAQLAAGVQLSYGWTTYTEVLGSKEGAKASGLLNSVWAVYDYEDLRFTGAYQGTFGLGNQGLSRHLGQVAANYRVLAEGPMQVYAGLGYHFLTASFDAKLGGQPKDFSFAGHGFAGQVAVDIELTPELHTSAIITASPWVNWSYRTSGNSTKVDSRSSFSAKLDLVYDFSDQLSVQLGLVGGSHNMPGFTYEGEKLGGTRGSYSAISLGVTQRF